MIWQYEIHFLIWVFAMERWRPSADSLRSHQVPKPCWLAACPSVLTSHDLSALNVKSSCERSARHCSVFSFVPISENRSLCRAWQSLAGFDVGQWVGNWVIKSLLVSIRSSIDFGYFGIWIERISGSRDFDISIFGSRIRSLRWRGWSFQGPENPSVVPGFVDKLW